MIEMRVWEGGCANLRKNGFHIHSNYEFDAAFSSSAK